MLRNLQVHTVSERDARAGLSGRKDRIKALANEQIEPWLTFSPRNQAAVRAAAEKIFAENAQNPIRLPPLPAGAPRGIPRHQLNVQLANPKYITEDDAEELGKGHEFATQTFKSHIDSQGHQFEKYLSSEFAARCRPVHLHLHAAQPGERRPGAAA